MQSCCVGWVVDGFGYGRDSIKGGENGFQHVGFFDENHRG